MPKESPYKMFFDTEIIKMKDDGRLHKFTNIHLNRNQECPEEFAVPLGHERTISIFVIITFGGLISILALVFERLVFLCRRAKSMHQAQDQKLKESERATFKMLLQQIANCIQNNQEFVFQTPQSSFHYKGLENVDERNSNL